MKLLPLGTIIKVNNHKTCIIGYASVEKELASIGGYFVVSYPLGFTNIDKVFFVPHNLEFDVLAEGYKTRPSEQVLDTLSKGLEMVEEVPVEDLLKFNQAYREIAMSQKEADEK